MVAHDAPLGFPRVHYRVTSSTNDRARELAARGAPHGTLVTAEEQTAGRGRQGRSWLAPAGAALLCSLVLRDPGELVSLAAGVAVAEVAGDRAAIKWPNDVLLEGRKVAGILVEGRPQAAWAVLGIGINVAGAPSGVGAGALGGTAADIEQVLGRLLDGLTRWLTAPAGEVLGAVRARDALRDRPVRWSGDSGVGAGIDDAGRLLVDTGSGVLALDAGEVHLGGPGGSGRPRAGPATA